MSYVPDHVLMMIFEKIKDPKMILKLRRICVHWHDLIENKFNRNNAWKQLCDSDHIKPWVYNIIEVILPKIELSSLKSLSVKTWREIYLFYLRWQSTVNFARSLSSKRLFHGHLPFSNYINCMEVQADYTAISTVPNKVYLFDTNRLIEKTSRQWIYMALLNLTAKNVNKFVKKVKFWYADSDNSILVVHVHNRSTKRSYLNYWDAKIKRKISNPHRKLHLVRNFTCSHHRLFFCTPNGIYECKLKDKKFIAADRVFDLRKMLGLAEFNKLKVLEMCTNFDRLSLWISHDSLDLITLRIPSEGEECEIIKIEQNFPTSDRNSYNIPIPGTAFSVYVLAMTDDMWNDVLQKREQYKDQERKNIPSVSKELFFIIVLDGEDGPPIYFYLSSLSSIERSIIKSVVSSNLWEIARRSLESGHKGRDNPYRKFKISSIFLYCNILFLGLVSGNILVYGLDSIETFIREDFVREELHTIKVTNEPIIYMNIIGNLKPILIVGSKRNVYSVFFNFNILPVFPLII